LGLPVRIILGPGQQNDMAPACDLIDGLAAQNVLADKAYDADRLYRKIIDQGGDPVVPPRRHRKRQHAYDAALYKERNRVERFFSRIKHFRRIHPLRQAGGQLHGLPHPGRHHALAQIAKSSLLPRVSGGRFRNLGLPGADRGDRQGDNGQDDAGRATFVGIFKLSTVMRAYSGARDRAS